MPIAWGLTATTIAAVAAVVLAGSARACEPFDGTYSLDNSGEPGALTTWIANSTVVPRLVSRTSPVPEDGAAMHSSWAVVGL